MLDAQEDTVLKYGKELEKDVRSILSVYATKMTNDNQVTSPMMMTVIIGGLLIPFISTMKAAGVPLEQITEIMESVYKTHKVDKRKKENK